MKILSIVITALLLFTSSFNPQPQDNVTITVTISNVRNSTGSLLVGLYNKDADFPQGEPYMTQAVALKSSSDKKITFEGVPAGDYAIAVIHDENGNEDMDTNEYGMPTEGFGFSNNAMGSDGPPSFNDAAFAVNKNAEISFSMMYLGGY
ncbi:DUF2141 domain-containing protein [Roseivirga echinicomitans]|uniref:DUF2141 domain-containing protein n=1 Tax=Roseivirga echinicomitans TaxID=296218 RepID=A0A150XY10_9BACT|nr:DUF2141 domain-containing protein [Roseivirga echinicomitans]KYG83601.1 hypothetical protein AWN68_02010 [Roseivirga echinicomitans]